MFNYVLKNIFLIFLFLINPLHSQNYPSFSPESKIQIAGSATCAGLGALGIFVVAQSIFNKFPRFGEHPKSMILIPTITAAITAWISSKYTPESHFAYAKDGIAQLEQNDLIKYLFASIDDPHASVIASINKFFIQEKFPLYAAFLQINELINAINDYKKSLLKVFCAAQLLEWHAQSKSLLLMLESIEDVLKETMQVIKDNPKFTEQNTAYALHVSSQAASSAASAAWVNALNRNISIH